MKPYIVAQEKRDGHIYSKFSDGAIGHITCPCFEKKGKNIKKTFSVSAKSRGKSIGKS